MRRGGNEVKKRRQRGLIMAFKTFNSTAAVLVLAVAVGSLAPTAALGVVLPLPTAYYPFDTGLGDAVGGNDGTSAAETITTISGRTALDTNPANSQVKVTSATGAWAGDAVDNNAITFSFWQLDDTRANSSTFWAVAPDASGGDRGAQAHVPWGNGTIFWDTAGCCGGSMRMTVGAGDTNDGAWHHFAFVKDGGFKAIYMDGDMLGSKTGASALKDFTDLWIGSAPGGGNLLKGYVDDFAVYDQALSEAEIKALAGGQPVIPLEIRFNADATGNGFDVVPHALGTQDNGTFEVQDGTGTDTTDGTVVTSGDGPTLKIMGNAWKKIQLPTPWQTIIPGYTLQFEFKSTDGGEVQGIVFDNNNAVGNDDQPRGFIPIGAQGWGNQSWPGYHAYNIGDGWTRYEVFVDQYFSGAGYQYLVFAGDEDRGGETQNGYFRDVTLSIVPEPLTMLAVGMSIAGLGRYVRRRRRG